MSDKTRLPATRGSDTTQASSVVQSGPVQVVTRPIGMVPHVSVEVTKEKRDLVLDLAENIFPGKHGIGDLKQGERERWVVLACSVMHGNPDISQEVEALAEVLGPGVQAEIEDTLLKRNFFFEKEEKQSEIEEEELEERKEREKATHNENLLDRAQARQVEKERWEMEKKERNKRLAMEVSKHKNSSWRERIGIGMAVIGFLGAAALLYLGLASGEKFVAGSSGAVAVAILGVVIRLLFLDQKQPPPPPPPGEATAST